MLRVGFLVILSIHGLIHLIGFDRAFHLSNIQMLQKHIARPVGILWLAAVLLFCTTAVMLLIKQQEWWITGLMSIILSQALIISAWQDAKYGTIANIVLLLGIIVGFGQWRFEKKFYSDVAFGLKQSGNLSGQIVTEKDLQLLPAPVQRYLRYVGVVGQPKVKSMRVVFEGRMRDKGKDWFPLRSVQYNFYDLPERLFFMKGHMFGMDVPGYHRYSRGVATMDIRLFGLYPVISANGAELNMAETVTLFNDMCFLAPATLIDPRIKWIPINDSCTKALFTCNSITISATLIFNARGQLINFVSNNRYAVADMRQYTFSTPVKNYRNIGGYNLSTFAEAIWHYPEGQFTYGEFRLKEVTYNINNIKK